MALLLSRLLIAVLFLFVGLSELHRLLFQPLTPYLPGDGHDVVWPKAVELLLAIPFTLGFQTSLVRVRVRVRVRLGLGLGLGLGLADPNRDPNPN